MIPMGWVAAVGLAGMLGTAAPIIGQTMDPTYGGCQMIVAGDGFVAGRTEFRVWSPEWKAAFQEADETRRLVGYLGRPATPLPETPGKTAVSCPVIRCTGSLAAVEFPRYGPWSGPRSYSYFALMYAGSDKEGWSRPWVLNRTEVHFLDRDAAAPGEAVRLFGRKLQALHQPAPVIVLVPASGGQPVVCPTQDIYYMHQHFAANYTCQFVVPEGTPAGRYLVRAHNHTGEAWGWSEPVALEVRTGRSPAPAVVRAADFGARGDGRSDDAAALQKALDAAGAKAPATVVLGPGTFVLSETLRIPAGVTLRGGGMHVTTLRPSQTPAFRGEREPIEGMAEYACQPQWSIFHVLVWGRTQFGLEDLAVEGAGDSAGVLVAVVNGREGLSENVSLRRCRLANPATALSPAGGLAAPRADGLVATKYWKGIFVGRARRLAIEHCEGENVDMWAFQLRESRVAFNRTWTPHYLRGGGTFGWGRYTTNVVVEHNRIVGPRGLPGPGGARHLLVAGNSVEKTLTCDGEAYMLEGAYPHWYGPVRCPDASTVVTAGANWRHANLSFEGLDRTDRQRWMEELGRDLTGCLVVVTHGRGVGQYRDVADARGDTIRLAQPWAVVPDGSSRVCVMRGDVHNTFVCNMAYDCNGTAGGLFYAGGMNCIVQNVQAVNSGPPYVWSTYRRAAGKEADAPRTEPQAFITPDYYNAIVDCRLFDSEGILLRASRYGHDSAEQIEGTVQLGTLVAYNEIYGRRQMGVGTSLQEAVRSGVRIDGPIVFPAIEGNTIGGCDTAVAIAKGVVGTLVRRNRLVRIAGQPVLDQGAETVVGGYVDKAEFHDYWPRGFNVLQLSGPAVRPKEDAR